MKTKIVKCCNLFTSKVIMSPVVQRQISANSGLNLNPGFFFRCSKASAQIFFLFFLEHLIIKA